MIIGEYQRKIKEFEVPKEGKEEEVVRYGNILKQ